MISAKTSDGRVPQASRFLTVSLAQNDFGVMVGSLGALVEACGEQPGLFGVACGCLWEVFATSEAATVRSPAAAMAQARPCRYSAVAGVHAVHVRSRQ